MEIDNLQPYHKNPRKITTDMFEKLGSSLDEYGDLSGIVFNVRNKQLVSGHQRTQHFKSDLKNTEVLINERWDTPNDQGTTAIGHIVFKGERFAYREVDWDEKKHEQGVIRANRIHGDFDWDMLANEFDMTDLLEAGFNEGDFGKFDDDLDKPGLTDDDDVPDAPEDSFVQEGDIFILGDHRVMCGDSTNIEDVEKLMQGQRADLLFTSPPYNAGDSEKLSGNTHTDDNKYGMYEDNKSDTEYLNLLCGFTDAWLRYSDCLAVNLQQLAGNKISFVDYLFNYRQHLIDIAIWNKGHGQPAMARNVMNSCFEYIVFLSPKDKATRAIPCADFRGTVKNIYEGSPNRSNEFSHVHAATFPIDFPKWALKSFTKRGMSVADCFAGTGTTLIACESMGRKSYNMELDPKYVEIIIERWEKFTGKKAEKAN